MVDLRLAPSPFEQFASDNQYDITPAVLPAADGIERLRDWVLPGNRLRAEFHRRRNYTIM